MTIDDQTNRTGMHYRPLPNDRRVTSVLGLGCSRLGSVTANLNRKDALRLISEAQDLGIAFFDTADIYAQGRSERLLGEALAGKRNAIIATKAGQVFPLAHRMLAPLRGIVAKVAAQSPALKSRIGAVRTKRLPRNFTPIYLRGALVASLRRLNRDAVDMFLLHSPSRRDLSDGVALDCLASLKQEGLARWVGVSCDDDEVLSLIADDPRVDIIQAPYGLNQRGMETSIGRAHARGAYIIAREVLTPDGNGSQPPVSAALSFALGHRSISTALIGTTRLDHLRAAASAVAGAQ